MVKSVYEFGKVRNKIYITNRNFGRHFMKKMEGFGISESVLTSLSRTDTKYVLIITDDCDYLYHLSQYMEGEVYDNTLETGKVDRQMFVSIRNTIELPKSE